MIVEQKEQPLVSFVIPAFNAGEFLRKTIISCLEQTYQNIELIIVNDGSTDNTENIIHEFVSNPKVHYFKNEKNSGLIFSLNRAINLAQGEYIARMDADDICTLDRIDKQIHFLKTHTHIDIVGGDILLIDENDHPYGRPRETLNSTEEIEWSMISSCPLYHPSVVFTKKSVEHIEPSKNIYYESEKIVEDLGLWSRSILKGLKIAVIDDVVLKYRKHQNSLTSQYNTKQIDAAIPVITFYAYSKWTLNLTPFFIKTIRLRNQIGHPDFLKEAKVHIKALNKNGFKNIAIVAIHDIQSMCLNYLHQSLTFKQKRSPHESMRHVVRFLLSLELLPYLPLSIFKYYYGIFRRFTT